MLHHYVITEPLKELIDLEARTAGGARPLFPRLSARGDQRHAGRPLRNRHRACLLGGQAAALGLRERTGGPRTRPPHALAGEGHRTPAALRPDRHQVHRSRAPSRTRRTASISRARRRDRRTTGCIAAPRSASARAAAPASTWRSGWCMARPRSTCANSIRAASATGRRKDYTAEVSVADYHHMYYCYKPAEQHEVGRDLRKSALYDKLKAEGAQFAADLRLGARRAGTTRPARASILLPPLELVGRGEGGSAGRARERGPDGPLDLLQVRRDGPGCPCLPRSHLRQQDSGEGRRHHPRPSAE